MSSYFCEKCHKQIPEQEATDSSIYIRRLFGRGDEDEKNLVECYNHDFCSGCARTFTTKDDFNDFLSEYYESYFVNTVHG